MSSPVIFPLVVEEFPHTKMNTRKQSVNVTGRAGMFRVRIKTPFVTMEDVDASVLAYIGAEAIESATREPHFSTSLQLTTFIIEHLTRRRTHALSPEQIIYSAGTSVYVTECRINTHCIQ